MYITNDQIMQDILADITYASASWCMAIRPSIKVNDGETVEDKWFNCLKRNGKLFIWEYDGNIVTKHEICYRDLSRAISVVRKMPSYKDETSWDGMFADAILQTAVFGEIVYD